MTPPVAATLSLSGLLALTACRQVNPDFGRETQAGETSPSSEGSETSTGEGSAEGTEGTEGNATSSSTDSGPTTGSDSSSSVDATAEDTDESETRGDFCSVDTQLELSPVFLDPENLGDDCPQDQPPVIMRVVGTDGGLLLGELCVDCDNCLEGFPQPIGAWGYDLAGAIDPNFPPANDLENCYRVEVRDFDEQLENSCHWQSIAVWHAEETEGPPLFAATKDHPHLPLDAADSLGDWAPILKEADHCECFEVEPGEPCCRAEGQTSFDFELDEGQYASLLSPSDFNLGTSTYEFYGAQAHEGLQCGVTEASWAILRIE